MGTQAIVKVQRPLSPGAEAPYLVYDEQRRAVVQVKKRDLPDHVVRSVAEPATKGYFNAEWDGQKWSILAQVPAQAW